MPLDKKAFQLGEITPANIEQLRLLNTTTLPVRYSDKFYKDILSTYDPEYRKFAFWNGFVVGGVCARIEDLEGSEMKKLYIMTINVFAAYRRRGIATELLEYIMGKAQGNAAIGEVWLHVQVGNEEAKQFYLHNGFTEKEVIKDYYKNIDPPDCYLLCKTITHDQLPALEAPDATAAAAEAPSQA